MNDIVFLKKEVIDRFSFLTELGYKFIKVVVVQRNIDFLFSNKRILVTITYNLSNQYIDIFIRFDFGSPGVERNLYYNSISLKDIFYINDDRGYDEIMPSKLDFTESIEEVVSGLKKYAMEILQGKKIVTEREIFYKDRSPFGGQPYSKSELKKIADFESSIKKII